MEFENGIGGPTLDKTTGIKCENCECEVFVPAFVLRKVSKLLIGAQQDGVIPINVFACANCGHVNKEFTPKGIEKLNQADECNKPKLKL